MLKLMMLTDNVTVAQKADEAGVDRIFYDLEYINKRERQRGMNTVVSHYDIESIPKIKGVLKSSELLVRINPIYFNTQQEVDKAIEYGADMIMLPMVCDENDVITLKKIVNNRAKINIMIETPQAFARLRNILDVGGIDEIFVGLNDLHIGMKLTFMFEVLAGGMVDFVAEECNKRGVPFGFGGIARIGEGDLPADAIIGEHYRLGSNSVILSRSFKKCFNERGDVEDMFDFSAEVQKIRKRELECLEFSNEQFENNKKNVMYRTKMIVDRINNNC